MSLYVAYLKRKFKSFSSVKSYISAQKTFHLDVFLLVRPKDLPLMSRALKASGEGHAEE